MVLYTTVQILFSILRGNPNERPPGHWNHILPDMWPPVLKGLRRIYDCVRQPVANWYYLKKTFEVKITLNEQPISSQVEANNIPKCHSTNQTLFTNKLIFCFSLTTSTLIHWVTDSGTFCRSFLHLYTFTFWYHTY